jgi:hypothetical protein
MLKCCNAMRVYIAMLTSTHRLVSQVYSDAVARRAYDIFSFRPAVAARTWTLIDAIVQDIKNVDGSSRGSGRRDDGSADVVQNVIGDTAGVVQDITSLPHTTREQVYNVIALLTSHVRRVGSLDGFAVQVFGDKIYCARRTSDNDSIASELSR